MQKILFLDVDGPLIPSGMYVINKMCSFERTCSPIAVAIVNKLCKNAEASIVLNSTHNIDGEKAKEELIREGLVASYFHESWKTAYPNKFSGGSRMECIEEWIEDHGEADWIAFDDSHFTDDERLILIDFDVGITLRHYNMAGEIWGISPILIY